MTRKYTMDDFDEKYTASKVDSECFDEESNPGMLETFGADRLKVIKMHNTQPKRVWTMVDGDDDELVLLAGFHFVNRLYYVITDEEWEDDKEEFCCP